MATLTERGLTTKDIELGGFDAESDTRLERDFITTDYVATALAGDRHIFLGRKGSGKSALFTQLPRLAAEQPHSETLVIDITPDAYAWKTLKSYQEQGIPAEQAHANAWELTLAIEVGVALLGLGEGKAWTHEARQDLYVIRQFIGDNFGSFRIKGLRTASSILKNMSSFNLGAFGFTAGGSRREPGPPQEMTPELTSALIDYIRRPLAEHRVIVELDRLDDAWDGSSESKSLLVGLLMAVKDLNDEFRRARTETAGLHALIFLRTDIYDALDFDDKDKHRPFEEQISWEEPDLRSLVTRRLPDGVSVDELFESERMRGSLLPFDHILKRTFLRPREVLQFVDLCSRAAPKGATQITKDDVRSTEARFSGWKVKDLKQEYAKSQPDLSPLMEALRQGVHRYDSFEQLLETLDAKQPQLVDRLGERGALEILFDASVIGIRLSNAGSTRFKSTEPDLSLPTSGSLYVHQSLHKGLNLTESRKPAEDVYDGPEF